MSRFADPSAQAPRRLAADPIARAARQAQADYATYRGSVVRVNRLRVTIDGREDYISLRRPARVRVVETPREMLFALACKDLLTPAWNVVLAEPHPDVPAGARLAIHPRTYGSDGHLRQGDICRTPASVGETMSRLLMAVKLAA